MATERWAALVEKNPIEVPTVANSLDELQNQVQEIAIKLNKIPYEQISADLHKTMVTLDKTLTAAETMVTRINNDVTPEITAAMKDARKTLSTAERTLADDSPMGKRRGSASRENGRGDPSD